MHWQSEAIVLSVSRFKERGGVVSVLTPESGRYAGVVRNAFPKKGGSPFQMGNRVNVEWSARLAEHLGNFNGELRQPIAALVAEDAQKLLALEAVCQLVQITLQERQPHPKIYQAVEGFLQALVSSVILSAAKDPEAIGESGIGAWQMQLARLELTLLSDLGYGLDLSHCAATGVTEDLCYVSPKSGRAVCREAGMPYHDRLLPLPAFLLEGGSDVSAHIKGHSREGGNLNRPGNKIPAFAGMTQTLDKSIVQTQEILDALRLTGYFLEKHVLQPLNRQFPAARRRLIGRWEMHATEHAL